MKNLGDSNTGVMSKTVDYLNQMLGAINKIGKADNITSKLGIDQRGKSWTEVPFAEMINLIGGVTVGQAENLKLADTYDALGKKIQEASTSSVKLQNLLVTFKQQRDGLDKANPEWKIYNERLKDAGEALNALNIERAKVKDAKGSAIVVNTNSLEFATKEVKRLNDELFKTNLGTSKYAKLDEELTRALDKLKELEHQALVSRIGKDITQGPTMDEQFARSMDVDLSSLQPAVKEVNDLQAGFNLVMNQSKELEVIGGVMFTPMQDGIKETMVQTNELAIELNNLAINTAEMFASGLGDAFAQSIIEGENFRQSMDKVFKDLGKMIIAQIVKMLALKALMALIGGPVGAVGSTAISGANIGANAGGIGSFLSGIFGNRVSTGVSGGYNSGGSVEFEIRGDKLYGVLQNYSSRLDRLV
jgi:hypothetical protein